MTESHPVQFEQAPQQEKTYEAPKLRHEGKWNKITTQLVSVPIDP